MSRLLVTLCYLCICWTVVSSQASYLNRPDLLNQVEECLNHTYNFSFKEARKVQLDLSEITPEHPAPLFLEALIVYWENFPLTPEKEPADSFVMLMDQVVEQSELLMEDEGAQLEGIFFDLFGRALKAMYWADNGKSGKVIPDLGTMYRNTKEGFALKDQFVEFYFSTGLYNYYIEAYPEAHPGYKPLVAFMKEGDKTLGLQQLGYAIDHAIYLRVESIFFMSLLQLNYEDDLEGASVYARQLHREFPNNLYYQGHLVTILLHLHQFEEVEEILEAMKHQEDSYSEMIKRLALAFMSEKMHNHPLVAQNEYGEVVKLADLIGPFADVFKAMAYMGLSRLNEQKELHSESKRYARKAGNHTAYKFILNEKAGDPR